MSFRIHRPAHGAATPLTHETTQATGSEGVFSSRRRAAARGMLQATLAAAAVAVLVACGGGGDDGGNRGPNTSVVKVVGDSLNDSGTFGIKFTVQGSVAAPSEIWTDHVASRLSP